MYEDPSHGSTSAVTETHPRRGWSRLASAPAAPSTRAAGRAAGRADRRGALLRRHTADARVLLVGVAVLFFVAQVTLVDVTRPPGFDEAIYLSEVQRGAEGISFAAHRARGITWLIQPVAGLGAPITVVRVWLALLSAGGLVLAYRPWIRSVGTGAPLAAALTASWWAIALHGTEVSPNVLAAFAATAATGYAFRAPSPRRGRDLVAVAVSMAALAVVRPTETVWLGLFLALVLPFRGRHGVALLFSAGVGTALGWLPWIVEAFLRFRGPMDRFRMLRGATFDVDYGQRLFDYLALADGPTSVQGPVEPMSAVAGVGALIVLGLIALGGVRLEPGTDPVAVRAAAMCGLFLLVPYVLLTDSVYVRFLFPAWALATVPLAEGLRFFLSRRTGVIATLATVALLGGWVVGQYTTVRHMGGFFTSTSRDSETLATAVQPLVEEPCYLLVEGGYPQVGYGVGCLSDWYRPGEGEPFRRDPATRAAGGRNVYVLGTRPHPLLEGWPSESVPRHPEWRLYSMPPSAR